MAGVVCRRQSESGRHMGDTEITIAQAAYLVRRNERAVRWHVGKGHLTPHIGADGHMRLDVEALAGVRGWRVDPARLAELRAADGRTAEALDSRICALEARVRDLEARLAAQRDQRAALPLSDVLGYPQPSDSALSALQGHSPRIGLSDDARHILSERRAPTVALADRGDGAPLRFKTKSDAARWLARHGVNEHTPKSWRGWPPDELTPTAVLDFALEIQEAATARKDWRVTWRLARCGDPLCVCRDLIED